MKVTVFGIGYVGLVQAAVLAEVGHEVVCVDTNRQKISDLNQGVIPIYEPGLAPLVQQNCAAGRLKFTTDATQGVDHAMLQFIAVGTPANTNGAADLQALFQVAQTIAEQMHDSKIIINKSTVPVGTSERVKKIIQQRLQQRGIELSFDVISNLAAFIYKSISNRCRYGFSPSILHLPMSRTDISNYLGVSLETVSRLFNNLQRCGIITTKGRYVTIHDNDKLARLAQYENFII